MRADDLAPFTLEPSIEMSELINHIKANRYHPSVGTDILPTDFYYQFYIMIQRSRHKKYLPVTVPSEIDWQNDAAYRFFLSLKPKNLLHAMASTFPIKNCWSSIFIRSANVQSTFRQRNKFLSKVQRLVRNQNRGSELFDRIRSSFSRSSLSGKYINRVFPNFDQVSRSTSANHEQEYNRSESLCSKHLS